jgi:hypothetical protein
LTFIGKAKVWDIETGINLFSVASLSLSCIAMNDHFFAYSTSEVISVRDFRPFRLPEPTEIVDLADDESLILDKPEVIVLDE